MTTRFKVSIAAGLTALTLAAAPAFVVAQQDQPPRRQGPGMGGPAPGAHGGPGMRGHGGPMGFGPGFRELDLTDDQKAQIKKINDGHREQFEQAGQKIQAARQAMQALIESDSIDESAIRAKSAEVASAEADAMILHAKVRQESMQVLTSEQLAKLKELRTNRQGQMKQRRPGRQR